MINSISVFLEGEAQDGFEGKPSLQREAGPITDDCIYMLEKGHGTLGNREPLEYCKQVGIFKT